MISPVNFTWKTSRSLPDVRNWVGSSVAATLRKAGYRIQSSTADELVMKHGGQEPWWLLLVSTLAFWMSKPRPHQVVFRFMALADGRTQMLAIGDLPDKVARILMELPQV